MVVYLSKPMIMRINPFVGISRMRIFRMVDMCKGKKKIMTTRHRWRPRCWIAHGWKKSESFVSQQRDILPCTLFFSFLLLDSSLSYPSCHSSFLLLFFFFHSFILIFFSFFTFLYFFFLSFPYSCFSLYFSISWQLFKALNSSLSCMHTIWNFK
jgi:hypothetical protein